MGRRDLSESIDCEGMIEVWGLTKRYGSTAALEGVDLEVPRGRFATVFGPNGAGKTTLTKILATLTKPSSGEVRIAGTPIEEGTEVRRKIGLVSHKSFLYGDLTSIENLGFYARMFDLRDRRDRIRELLEMVGLKERANEPVRSFSRGMEQRLAIARALLHEPEVLLLDEPYTGLDLGASEMLKGVLERVLEMRKTVLMTTHDVERGLEFCERAVILVNGKEEFIGGGDMGADEFRELYERVTTV